MEISRYSTIDFSKSRNLLTERQKNIKAFNPIVPVGGCISLLELNPLQYTSIVWTFINQKTGKRTATTANSSDSMHYVNIPEGLRLGTYKLEIVTEHTEDAFTITQTTISKPFEYVEASEDVVTIVSRSTTNDLVGNVPPNATVIQPIYVNPLKIVELADVDDTDIAAGKILQVAEDGETHEYVDPPTGGGGFTKQTLTDAASISWNAANGNYATVTIAGDRTIANPSNFTVGQELILDITQGTGGSHTLTFDTYFTFAGGITPILSSAEGATDSLRFLVVSTTEIRLTNANFDV